jgi:hypothetical protein
MKKSIQKVPTTSRRALTLLVSILVIHSAISLFTSENCPANCDLCNDDVGNNYCVSCENKFYVKKDLTCESLEVSGDHELYERTTLLYVDNYNETGVTSHCSDYSMFFDSVLCTACDPGYVVSGGGVCVI